MAIFLFLWQIIAPSVLALSILLTSAPTAASAEHFAESHREHSFEPRRPKLSQPNQVHKRLIVSDLWVATAAPCSGKDGFQVAMGIYPSRRPECHCPFLNGPSCRYLPFSCTEFVRPPSLLGSAIYRWCGALALLYSCTVRFRLILDVVWA